MKTIVVAVCGLANTGKNTVGDILVREYGFIPLDYTQDVLGPMLEKKGKAVVRENLSALATELRRTEGPAILTELLTEKIHGNSVITGLRAKEEAKYLRKRFGKCFFLIGVVVDPEIRYQRAVERNAKGEGKLNLKQFLEKDRLPTELLIAETIAGADFLIDNNGTEKELERTVAAVAARMGLKN